MRRPLHSLVIAVLAVGGCSGSERTPGRTPGASTRAAFTDNPATGETSARVALKGEAPATLRSGPHVPVTLPRGFTLYPGAKITANTVVQRGGSERVLLVFETPASLETIVGFYRAQAKRAGAILRLDLVATQRASIGGTLSGERVFALAARRQGDISRVELSFD